MALTVKVQRARCIGTKACVSAAPGTFSVDDFNLAVGTDPPNDPEADLIEAAESCPTGAITVWRDDQQIA